MSRARLNADHYAGSTDASVLSGVLPVGVTGGSGLTALGTVTVGNLSNTAIVYPIGHVIQTKQATSATQSAGITATSWASSTLHACTCVITPYFATSNILLQANYSCIKSTGGYSKVDFYKDCSDITANRNLSGKGYGCATWSTGASWHMQYMIFLDDVTENSTTEKTYKISAISSDGNHVEIGWGSTQLVTITAMEIAT